MKKLLTLLLLLPCILLSACNHTDVDTIAFTRAATEPEVVPDVTEVTAPAEEASALVFLYEGVELIPGQPFDPAALPEAQSTFTVPSCALDGTDNVYSYGNLEITAFNDGTGEFIYSVYLLDETLATPEGLRISDPQEKVLQLYGTDFQDNGGEYLYTQGDVLLSILFQNGTVSSIEYLLSTV